MDPATFEDPGLTLPDQLVISDLLGDATTQAQGMYVSLSESAVQ